MQKKEAGLNWSVLRFQGQKPEALLQGQSSCDILALTANKATMGSFFLPNGKAYATFIAIKINPNTFDIILHTSLTKLVIENIAKYIPFFRTTVVVATNAIEPVFIDSKADFDKKAFFAITYKIIDGKKNIAISLNNSIGLVYAIGDEIDGVEDSADASNSNIKNITTIAEFNDWNYSWLKMGLIMLTAPVATQFTPNMLNYDLSGAIDFEKGCYTGQEVIARTHYLGKAKKHCQFFCVDEVVADYVTYSAMLPLCSKDKKTVGWLLNIAASKTKTFGQVMTMTTIADSSIYLNDIKIEVTDFSY